MIPKINNLDLDKKIKSLSDVRIIGLLAFGVVVLLVSWSSLRVLQMNYELQKQETNLRQQNQVQKLENENLALKNVYFESDEYLELSARKQLNKAAPGEKLYLIPPTVAMARTVELPKTEQQLLAEQSQSQPKHQQNLQAWKDFFLHINKN